MVAGRYLGFNRTGNNAIRSGGLIRLPLKPYPRTKHEADRMTCCGDMAIRNVTY